MGDPLSLLRHFIINKKEIIERDDKIIFGEFSWPKNVETNFLKKFSKDCTKKEYYTLECLLFFVKNISLIHPEYVRQASAKNISAVRRPDRNVLRAYLNGDIAISNIDKSAPLGLDILKHLKKEPVESVAVGPNNPNQIKKEPGESEVKREADGDLQSLQVPKISTERVKIEHDEENSSNQFEIPGHLNKRETEDFESTAKKPRLEDTLHDSSHMKN
ncbi:hypothetical protein LSTR_LSTR008565 [Laodelphax striatellus]|uniref:Paf1 complex subunit Cdc73 N-terminal domain-containing protein n=1 Tax=Laodelphax striatellus TaxID=195883 RepID=A0A482WV90_LAOST|nr:hypothetical protein LSTR_LSTR008565 [Laodelphax striatellus]